MIKGIGVSNGIAIGHAIVKKEMKKIVKENIADSNSEILRYLGAHEAAESKINQLIEDTKRDVGEDESKIFSAHIMMLNDPEYVAGIKSYICDNRVNAEWAVSEVSKTFISMFEMIDDEYLSARADDIRDISLRIIGQLTGFEDVNVNVEGGIVVASNLTPSDTVSLESKVIGGFITELGSVTSHSAIVARTKGIPAVVGVSNLLDTVKTGDVIGFNGRTGEVFISPNDEKILELKKLKEEEESERLELEKFIGKQSISKDNQKVEVACNIANESDVENVIENGGEGIGLFRSEFLFMDSKTLPNEETQFKVYSSVLEGMGDEKVIIRTLDVGGDKEIEYFDIPKEDNPFLGYRAIRYCLKNPKMFKVQLRALIRASVYGNLHIMLPMISNIHEIRDTKKLLIECEEELMAEGLGDDFDYKLGIMIEIPSAAIMSDVLAKEVDFFSIGTNDLVQYTVAVDRMNEEIAELYTPFNPGVLRLVKMVIDNAHSNGIWVGMCGSAAGNEKLVPLLLGMGLDEFSVSPTSVLNVRRQISTLSKEYLKGHVDKILSLSSKDEILEYLEKLDNQEN